MRHAIVGLSFLAVLVVAFFLGRADLPLSGVDAQAVSESQGRFLMATAVFQNGNRSQVYILDTQDLKLASYTTDGSGILYLGTRLVEHDLKPQQLDPTGKRYSVKDVMKLIK